MILSFEDLGSNPAVVSSDIGLWWVSLHVFLNFLLSHAQCGSTCGNLVEGLSLVSLQLFYLASAR